MKFPASGIYAESGMATIHNAECINDNKFRIAYNRAIKSAGMDYGIRWKTYIACWLALQASHAGDGDFVECGVNKGIISSAIMVYLDWNTLKRRFYLIDTFMGIDEGIFSEEEKAAGYISSNRKALVKGHDTDNVKDVKKNFSEWSQTQVIQGSVPNVLKDIFVKQIAFIHIDMNNATPERAATDRFCPL